MPDGSTTNKPRVRRTAGFSRRLARYSAGTLTLAGSASLAHADFSGTYSLTPPAAGSYTVTGTETFGTWTTSETTDGGTSTYTLNDASDPASVSISDAAPGTYSILTLANTAPSAGTFSFSYTLTGVGGYEVDGSQNYLGSNTSGTVTNVALSAGQSFGFFTNSYAGTSTLTISNFSAPVPEPGVPGWIAAGAAGLLATRALRRRAAARASLPV